MQCLSYIISNIPSINYIQILLLLLLLVVVPPPHSKNVKHTLLSFLTTYYKVGFQKFHTPILIIYISLQILMHGLSGDNAIVFIKGACFI